MMINVSNNLETEEVYKHVWIALLLNSKLTVEINDPRSL